MSVAVVTDSAAALPDDLAARHGIEVVPLWLHIGDDSYRLRDLVIAGPELGRLELSGTMHDGRIEAQADARDVPLGVLVPEQAGIPWSGGLARAARGSGPVERPLGTR
jgi:hypothetical protein